MIRVLNETVKFTWIFHNITDYYLDYHEWKIFVSKGM